MTGPGGTEFITRPARRESREVRRDLPEREKPKVNAYELRQSVARAKAELASAVNGHREVWQYELDLALGLRQQFWTDTCREVREMRAVSKQVLHLNVHHGHRFYPPSSWQVQHILDALDAASDTWDRDYPELFYETLELNFRELRRICRINGRM
jgi:hypothetical protein